MSTNGIKASILEESLDVGYISQLYDFYGNLLDSHQKEVMDAYHEEDLSLAEIADNMKMSRQGVHYTLKKAEKKLIEYEDKLGMIDKYRSDQKRLKQAEIIINKLSASKDLSEEQMEDIEKLKEALELIAD